MKNDLDRSRVSRSLPKSSLDIAEKPDEDSIKSDEIDPREFEQCNVDDDGDIKMIDQVQQIPNSQVIRPNGHQSIVFEPNQSI